MKTLTIKELRKLPFKKWNSEAAVYKKLSIINSGKKHKSGYALFYIIGWEGDDPKEIVSACDHINWDLCNEPLEMDMLYPSGLIRYWVFLKRFYIKEPGESINISLIDISWQQEKELPEVGKFYRSIKDTKQMNIGFVIEITASSPLKISFKYDSEVINGGRGDFNIKNFNFWDEFQEIPHYFIK